MHALARWVLGATWQSVLVISLCYVVPYLAMLGIVLQVFVTLRQGPAKGLTVSLISVVIGVLAGFILASLFSDVNYNLIGQSMQFSLLILLPLLAFAILLRQSVSLNLTAQVITLIAVLMFIICYTLQIHLFPDAMLEQVKENTAKLSDVIANMQANNVSIDQAMVKQINQFMVIMFEITSLYSMYLALLMLARAYQSYIFMPNAFAQEFQNLKCSSLIATVLVLCWLLELLPYNMVSSFLLGGVLIIGLLWLILVGVALVHWLVARYNISKVYLGIFYLLFLIPILSSLQLFILMIMGLIDGFVNIRAVIPDRKM